MADFKTALEAFAKGALQYSALADGITRVVSKNPKLTTQILNELSEAHRRGVLDAQSFANLKSIALSAGGAAIGAGDSTVFAGGGAPVDKTQVVERTQVDERTQVMDRTGAQEDLSAPSLPSGGSNPTSSSWSTTGSGKAEPVKHYVDGQPIGSGTVLKERFILDDVIGVGGMGTVYRGRDILKVEARDRNPYVALKVLNEDFKQHPDAFIALQREASRQQKLAHPNIATVYDFDRTGSTVFLTMELMEGQPLNIYIKKVIKPKGGMPFADAIKIVRGLGAALRYAHERKIVHSDFKPGNCFLLNSGDVKVLDFGIARAVKNPGQSEGEKTLFDPGKLGALTPAYASAEMLDGMDPQPPDDTYALACVAYELFTGRHPFNKQPANKARDQKLAPAPVKILNRRQNRALLKGLAFSRAQRSKNVAEFVAGLEDIVPVYKNPFYVIPAAAVLASLIAIGPVSSYLHKQARDQLTAALALADQAPDVMQSKLSELAELNPDDQEIVKKDAGEAILNFFSAQIQKNIEQDQIGAANALAKQAGGLFKDSVKFKEINEMLDQRVNEKFSEIIGRFNAALKNNKLTADANDNNDLTDVMTDVRKLDEKYPLLEDARLPAAYAQAAETALNSNDLTRANDLVAAGEQLKVVANSLMFQNLGFKVKSAVERSTVEKAVQDGLAGATGLADFASLRDAVTKLAGLNAQSPALALVADKIKPLIESGIPASIATIDDWRKLDALRNDFGVMLSAVNLKPLSQQIAQTLKTSLASLSPTDQTAIGQEQQKRIEEGKTTVATLLAEAKMEPAWETLLQAALLDVESRIAGDDAWLKTTHESIAKLYAGKATDMLNKQRFAEATVMLDKAGQMAPSATIINDVRTQLVAKEAEARKAEEAKALKAQIETQKQTFVTQAKAKDAEAARETFAFLQSNLPAEDVFIKQQAPTLLASAYAFKAKEKATAKDISGALQLAKAGIEVAPNDLSLRSLVKQFAFEGNAIELRKLFSGNSLDVGTIQNFFDEMRSGDPQKYAALANELVNTGLGRVDALKDSPALASGYTDALKKLFPGNSKVEALQVQDAGPGADVVASIDADIVAGNLTRARDSIKTAQVEFPKSGDLERLSDSLKDKRKEAETAYDAFRSAFEGKNLTEAETQLAKAEAAWKDSEALTKARRKLDGAKSTATAGPTPSNVDATAGPTDVTADKALPPPPASKQPCSADMAGYGERKKGTCFEMVTDRARGPLMVVVPAGGGSGKPFAIGKYEVTVADFNLFCKVSGKCAGLAGERNLPATGVTRPQAEAYAAWLTERTGKKFRLPTAAEWQYAAEAGGKQPKKDYNCRVEQGGQVLKGQAVMAANTGKPNGWGLYNYVGNVQELTQDGQARGGAFSDKFGNCEISLSRPSTGGDEVTGFRLVEELG